MKPQSPRRALVGLQVRAAWYPAEVSRANTSRSGKVGEQRQRSIKRAGDEVKMREKKGDHTGEGTRPLAKHCKLLMTSPRWGAHQPYGKEGAALPPLAFSGVYLGDFPHNFSDFSDLRLSPS